LSNLRRKAKSIQINPQKVAIYVRWSTDEQAEGTTLTIQLERSKQFILSQGWTINDDLIYIDEGFSGGSLDRPEIKKLRKDVNDGLVDCVVIFKLDRLSRNIVDTVNLVLEEWDEICYIKSVTEEPFDTTQQIGRQILTMLAGFAEWERYNIKLRTFEGKIETVEKGFSPGITPPYGYIVGEKTGTFQLVQQEANVVKRIFREYRNGKGTRIICTGLNSEGVPFKDGKKWNTNTIAYMLSNPLYIGRLVYGKLQNNPKRSKKEGEPLRNRRADEDIMVKELSRDVITPIIDVDEFYLIQKIRKSRNVFTDHKTSGRIFTSQHLLSGLLKCKTCGYGLTARGKQGNDSYAYYVCRGNKMKGTGFCDAGNIRQDTLDDLITQDFKNECLNRDNSMLNIISEQNESRLLELSTSLDGVATSSKRLEQEFETIKKKLRKDNLDVNTFNMIKNDIEKENSELKVKQQLLLEEIYTINSNKIDKNEIEELYKLLNIWKSLSIEEQKQILFKWIDYVEVHKTKGKETPNSKISINIHYKTKFTI